MNKSYTCEYANQQRGAVLAISLIVLAVLTILGVAALNTSALQSTMANNFQFQIGAMENAEVSVGIGEDIAVDIVDTGDIGFELFDTANNEFQLGGTVDPTDLDWTASGYSPRATANGEYVVEYVGIIPLGTGNDVAVGVGEIISGNMGHFFIVSARSKTNKGATRTLQTTLVTLVP